VIWRIRDRGTFARFRRDGRRFRVDPLWMSVIADPVATPPRVAFAVGRSVGKATVRNRIRRRLRALARAHAAELAPGWYLVGADASFAVSPSSEADAQFVALLRAAGAPNASSGPIPPEALR
jgi:ribonuclease P protein component